MSEMKPNHICKNLKCTKGTDGGRKRYFACDYCDRVSNWKSVACSYECWIEYQKAVIEERERDRKRDLLPERTDMDKEQVKELMNEPIEVVKENTLKQLGEYTDKTVKESDVTQIVDEINQEIDKVEKRTRKKSPAKNRKA